MPTNLDQIALNLKNERDRAERELGRFRQDLESRPYGALVAHGGALRAADALTRLPDLIDFLEGRMYPNYAGDRVAEARRTVTDQLMTLARNRLASEEACVAINVVANVLQILGGPLTREPSNG